MSGIDPSIEETREVLREALTAYVADQRGRKAELAAEMLAELD